MRPPTSYRRCINNLLHLVELSDSEDRVDVESKSCSIALWYNILIESPPPPEQSLALNILRSSPPVLQSLALACPINRDIWSCWGSTYSFIWFHVSQLVWSDGGRDCAVGFRGVIKTSPRFCTGKYGEKFRRWSSAMSMIKAHDSEIFATIVWQHPHGILDRRPGQLVGSLTRGFLYCSHQSKTCLKTRSTVNSRLKYIYFCSRPTFHDGLPQIWGKPAFYLIHPTRKWQISAVVAASIGWWTVSSGIVIVCQSLLFRWKQSWRFGAPWSACCGIERPPRMSNLYYQFSQLHVWQHSM